MLPSFNDGDVLLLFKGRRKGLKRGDIVMFRHQGIEKIKRIVSIRNELLWLEGDNKAASTDSRDFGSVPIEQVIAKVVAPICRNKRTGGVKRLFS